MIGIGLELQKVNFEGLYLPMPKGPNSFTNGKTPSQMTILDARGLVESFVGQPSAGKTSLASSIASPLSENLCAYALGDKMRLILEDWMRLEMNAELLPFSNLELEQVEQDPYFIMLSRQFKATSMELISILELKQKTGGRTKVLLDNVPFHKLAEIFVASFEISFEEQLSMLDSVDPKVRLSKATELADRHLQSIRVAEKITQKVEGQLSKSQKEFLLCQQMRAIKEELGDNDDDEDDLAALERKMQSAGMPQSVWKHAHRQLRRLKKMQPQQPGYNSSRVYVELLPDLPWQKASEEIELDLRAAQKRLDSDHYGLVKVKQRIIEYLAICKLKLDVMGPVLCFVGPPGIWHLLLLLLWEENLCAYPLAESRMRLILEYMGEHSWKHAWRLIAGLKLPRFDGREAAERVAIPGASVGLVWTTFGREVQFVEATTMLGKGELTGQVGDVRARATDLRLAATEGFNLLEGRDVHIHFPASAVPKDEPSAGVTLVTALVSLFRQQRVRLDTAMTGEMTLRGLVLPVGGVKEKILAAHHYGIKRVILPERNLKDLVEVPSSVLANLEHGCTVLII
ncbi:Lon protease-like 2, peroxisomal, partial [Mucuna pruriens]